ncbi:UNVERIFIED_CONTAM: Rrad [Trichonephila clavipes]
MLGYVTLLRLFSSRHGNPARTRSPRHNPPPKKKEKEGRFPPLPASLKREAKSVACSYECKFIETSAAINHQVDELLVGIVTQIRLKAQQQLDLASFNSNSRKESRSLQKRMSLGGSSHKAKGILNKLLGKGRIKSQSCGNLHVL